MPDEIVTIISSATRRNWNRLHVEDSTGRLASRANKRLSEKNVVPLEYVSSSSTVEWITDLLGTIRANGWSNSDVMYSLCVNLLRRHSLRDAALSANLFSDLPKCRIIEEILCLPLPEGEQDLLGLMYQSILSEGARNRMGAYYTPPSIVRSMTENLPVSAVCRCIDPCCGSGAFLTVLLDIGIPGKKLFGCDSDPIAVMLARVNLLIVCRDADKIPQVVCADFLRSELSFPKTFDLIITNPPWGALSDKLKFGDLTFIESFSCFLYAACQRLRPNGTIRFLLPEAFLNVRTHQPLRRYLLEKKSIREIRFYDESFSGVTTRCISVEIRNAAEDDLIHLRGSQIDARISASLYRKNTDCIIRPLEQLDCAIIEKMYALGTHSLTGSTWALGIVTGNNKKLLLDAPQKDAEPIYTGKEIEPFVLASPKKYICYNRSAFQQVARDEYYRAKEKLIYRFICDRPVFALDKGGTLCLNSANILIPQTENLSVYALLALLNSAPIQYLYMKLFGGVKVLKSYLEKLPLPELTAGQDAFISAQVRLLLCVDAENRRMLQDKLNRYFFELYGFCEAEQLHILSALYHLNKERSS